MQCLVHQIMSYSGLDRTFYPSTIRKMLPMIGTMANVWNQVEDENKLKPLTVKYNPKILGNPNPLIRLKKLNVNFGGNYLDCPVENSAIYECRPIELKFYAIPEIYIWDQYHGLLGISKFQANLCYSIFLKISQKYADSDSCVLYCCIWQICVLELMYISLSPFETSNGPCPIHH